MTDTMTDTMTTQEVWEARRDAAIAFFDRHIGYGWQERIDLQRLNIEDGACCIAGQVFGEYGTAEMTAQLADGITEEQWIAYPPDGGEAPWMVWGVEHAFLSDEVIKTDDLEARWREYLAAA